MSKHHTIIYSKVTIRLFCSFPEEQLETPRRKPWLRVLINSQENIRGNSQHEKSSDFKVWRWGQPYSAAERVEFK